MVTETKTRRIEPDITVVEISERLNLGNILVSIETSIKDLIEKGARKLVIDVCIRIRMCASTLRIRGRSRMQ